MTARIPRTNADLAARRISQGVHTFRGPLLPAGRRDPGIPVALEAWPGFALITVAHWIERRYAAAMEEIGISLRDFVVLAEIARRPGLSQATLAKRAGLSRSRVSEQLEVLETAGYVWREINPRDLRRRRLLISRDGRDVVEEGKQRLTAIDKHWLSRIDRTRRPFLIAALRLLASEPPAT